MSSPTEKRRLLYGIMLAVLVWGVLLAIGAALFGPDPDTGQVALAPNLWRGVIVLACVGFFLGGWWLLVMRRA
jgi:hypothetical protein